MVNYEIKRLNKSICTVLSDLADYEFELPDIENNELALTVGNGCQRDPTNIYKN